jgi:hypothetical protein
MDWCRILIGFVGVNFIAGLVLYGLLDVWLWPRFFNRYLEHKEKERLRDPLLTFLVGTVERVLYTLALCIGAWQWIGLWVGIKVATRWRSKLDSAYGPTDNIWLLGTALSLTFACIGAAAVGHLTINGLNH